MIDETSCFYLATSRITISDGVWHGKRVVCGSWLDHAFFSFTSLGAALVAFLWHEVTGSDVQQLWARLGFDVLWFYSCNFPKRCLSGNIPASPQDSANARHH